MTVTRRHFIVSSTIATCFHSVGDVQSASLKSLPTVGEIRAKHPQLWQLVDMINEHRASLKLKKIALSPSMSAVAALHAKDLADNKPNDKGKSLHCWSNDSRWTGGSYDPKAKDTWPIMWDKPKEITGYSGYGFEVAAAKVRDMKEALKLWKSSRTHYDVILNRGTWADPRWQWKALGAVFYKGYACAWFGDRE